MTTATKLKNEGRKDGRIEGLERGKLQAKKKEVVNLFRLVGFSVDQIISTYGYDRLFVEQVLKENGLLK